MSLPFQQLCLFEGFLILTCTCLRYVFNLSSYFVNRTVWVVQVHIQFIIYPTSNLFLSPRGAQIFLLAIHALFMRITSGVLHFFTVNWFEHMLRSLKCEEVDPGMPFLAVSGCTEILESVTMGSMGKLRLEQPDFFCTSTSHPILIHRFYLPESSTFGRGSLPLRVHTKFVQSWASLPTTLQDKRPRPENPSCGPWLRRSGEQTLHRCQHCHPCQASLNIASHDVLCDCCNSKSCPWTWWQHIAMRCN